MTIVPQARKGRWVSAPVVVVVGLLVCGAVATGLSGAVAGQSQQQRLVLSLETGTVEDNGDAHLDVTVANASPEVVRGVSVRVVPDDADVVTDQRVAASLEPGEGRTFTYTLEDVSPGPQEIEIFMNYADTDGVRHGEFRRRHVRFSPSTGPHPELAVGASPVSQGGATTVNLTVANGLDESIRSMSLEISPTSFDVDEPRRVRSGLGTGETAVFSFQASGASSGRTDVPVSVSYTTANGTQRSFERELALTLSAVRNPARVTLTELRVTAQGDRLTVRGSASNVGASDATGVVIAVEPSNGVQPAESESTFFVGRVPASDFNSFEVGAEMTTNRSVDIPLRVSYVAGDTRMNRTIEISYDPGPAPEIQGPNRQGSSGGVPITAIVGGIVVLGLLALAWRRFG